MAEQRIKDAIADAIDSTGITLRFSGRDVLIDAIMLALDGTGVLAAPDSAPFAKSLWLFSDAAVLQLHRQASEFLALAGVTHVGQRTEPEAQAIWQTLSAELARRGILSGSNNMGLI